MIISIQRDALKISYIPRDIRDQIHHLFGKWDNQVLYGTHIDGDKVRHFLENEANIRVQENMSDAASEPIEEKGIIVDTNALSALKKSGTIDGTVILTTSMK